MPAAVEAAYRLSGTEQRNVAEATDVQDRPGGVIIAKQRLMEGRYQRGALAAGCDVAAAEVGDDIDAGQFRQQGGVADLHREVASGFMPDGLTVTADGTDFVGAHLLLEQQFAHALCCKGDPALLDFGGAGDFIGTGDAQGEDVFAQPGRHG